MNILLTIFIRETVFYCRKKKVGKNFKCFYCALISQLTMKPTRNFLSTWKKNSLQCLTNPKNRKINLSILFEKKIVFDLLFCSQSYVFVKKAIHVISDKLFSNPYLQTTSLGKMFPHRNGMIKLWSNGRASWLTSL